MICWSVSEMSVRYYNLFILCDPHRKWDISAMILKYFQKICWHHHHTKQHNVCNFSTDSTLSPPPPTPNFSKSLRHVWRLKPSFSPYFNPISKYVFSLREQNKSSLFLSYKYFLCLYTSWFLVCFFAPLEHGSAMWFAYKFSAVRPIFDVSCLTFFA